MKLLFLFPGNSMRGRDDDSSRGNEGIGTQAPSECWVGAGRTEHEMAPLPATSAYSCCWEVGCFLSHQKGTRKARKQWSWRGHPVAAAYTMLHKKRLLKSALKHYEPPFWCLHDLEGVSIPSWQETGFRFPLPIQQYEQFEANLHTYGPQNKCVETPQVIHSCCWKKAPYSISCIGGGGQWHQCVFFASCSSAFYLYYDTFSIVEINKYIFHHVLKPMTSFPHIKC